MSIIYNKTYFLTRLLIMFGISNSSKKKCSLQHCKFSLKSKDKAVINLYKLVLCFSTHLGLKFMRCRFFFMVVLPITTPNWPGMKISSPSNSILFRMCPWTLWIVMSNANDIGTWILGTTCFLEWLGFYSIPYFNKLFLTTFTNWWLKFLSSYTCTGKFSFKYNTSGNRQGI